MSKLALNKSTLHKEGRKVKAYKTFVPALDLKRKQLLAARARVRKTLRDHEQQLARLHATVREHLPMAARFSEHADKLIAIEQIDIVQTNLVGLHLPSIKGLSLKARSYSLLGTEPWVDHLTELLMQVTEITLHQQVLTEQLKRLEVGVQKTTQRLNLFDKVLIPEAQKNIRRIKIALSDHERAAVVTSKIAKNKRHKAGLA